MGVFSSGAFREHIRDVVGWKLESEALVRPPKQLYTQTFVPDSHAECAENAAARMFEN